MNKIESIIRLFSLVVLATNIRLKNANIKFSAMENMTQSSLK